VRKNIAILAVFLLALAPRASGQVSAGEAKLNLNGTVSLGYTDNYSNLTGSDHGIAGGATADVSGAYFNPNFLSFDIQPFYNQSRDNSSSQSITAASGVNASAKVFGGSSFPGSISYTTTFNSSGNFNIPGLTNYTTHGNSDVLAINWGVHLDDLPTLNFSFSNANNAYSIYGTDAQGTLHSNMFSVSTAYQVAGFSLNGGYQHSGSNALTPELLTGEPPQESNIDSNSFSFGITHNLPGHGNFSAAATRLNLSSNLGDTASSDSYNTHIDTVTSGVNFAPRTHLTLGANAFYTDNLEGTLYNTLVTSGVSVVQNEGQTSSHDMSLTGYAGYDMPEHHLVLHGYVERQQQTYLGIEFASDSANGQATYFNTLLGGSFNGVVGVTWSALNINNQSLVGVNASVNYTHQIQRWTVAGAFSYSQAAQTLLIAYTSSGYNYSGSLGRRIRRRSYWGVYASGARTLLTDEPGTANTSQSYSTSLSLSRYSLSGSYSQSSGNALLTTTGLVTTPVPLPSVNPASVVFYNGKSVSMGLGANPIHGLSLSAVYAKGLSNTVSSSTTSNNNNANLNFLLTYNVRKLAFNAGYSRLNQSFSLSGTPPTMLGSFYVGISRWFNLF
jgi:hypothetical protein